MKIRLLTFLLLVACLSGLVLTASAQKVVSIPQVQFVNQDSLVKLEAAPTATSSYGLDKSPYWHGTGTTYNDDAKNDTVTVTGVVIVAPRVLTYTLTRYNIFIQDSAGRIWGGLNVLTDDTSANAQLTNITALDTGMVVTVTGKLKEYSASGQTNSLTELLAYSPGFYQTITQIQLVGLYAGTGVRPDPIPLTVDSFAVGTTPKPTRAEKYEGMYVSISNVIVNSVDPSSGRFTFTDGKGNQMQVYDGSGWYTYRGHKITGSKYTVPPVGTLLKSVRGVILPQARANTCGDYTIMPLYPGPKEKTGSKYPGDIIVDKYGPAITSIRRMPTPPKSSDIVNVIYKSYNPNTPSQKADSTFFRYRVGTQTNKYGTGWQRVRIDSVAGDTVYRATIPAQANNSLVSYFIESYLGGIYSASPDSSIPSFYVIKDAGLSIYDVAFTPYSNGCSGFAYDTVTVGGVIVADTSDIKDVTTRGGRSNAHIVWLQGSTATWAGIQIWTPSGTSQIVDTLKRGDSVVVRGSVYGTSNRTQIAVTSIVFFKRGGNVTPAPTVRLMTSPQYFDYQLSNTAVAGSSTFQPYMSMLLELDTMYVALRNADNLLNTSGSNYGEFFITNVKTAYTPATYGLRVNDNGVNRYYADTSAAYIPAYNGTSTHAAIAGIKKTLIPLGAKLISIRGILDYTNGNYKLEPRKDDDFGAISFTGVSREENSHPMAYQLSQNYPNPFNPSTIIEYSLPIGGQVSLKIYNILGQQVESLVNMDQNAGSYTVQFNASRLATGVYFYELHAGSYRAVKKMLLVK
jgi:hypothetical protein